MGISVVCLLVLERGWVLVLMEQGSFEVCLVDLFHGFLGWFVSD